MTAILEGRGLYAGYGDMPVVRDLNMTVSPGEVVALLGPNGAGKTTTLLTLAGALKPLSGEVFSSGRAVRSPLQTRARGGLALLTDDRTIFRELTAKENLRLGDGDPAEAVRLFPELAPLLKRKAGLLSGGEQQMLGLARALARKPKVLLADELSLGLAPIIVGRLLTAVRQAANAGTAVILVEQQVRLALDVCDRAYVLQRGEVVLRGSGEEVRENRIELERVYLAVPDERSPPAGV